jgi:hypothetical protein
MSCNQKVGQKHCIETANRAFEDVAKFKYLRITLMNQNFIHEKIKSRLNSGNACYNLVQRSLSSCPLSRNVMVKIHKTIVLPSVLYGCETWPVTLREKYRLRVFENRLLRRICGPKTDEITGKWRRLHSWKLHNLCSSPDIIRFVKSRRMR